MGMLFTCDCGKQKVTDNIEDLVPMGVNGQLYCKGECADIMQEFLDERDELHDEVMQKWQEGMAELHEKYHEKGYSRLPDELEAVKPKEDDPG